MTRGFATNRMMLLLLLTMGAVSLFSCSGVADSATPKAITDYRGCVEAGNPIMRSYPPQCITPDGTIFVEQLRDTHNEQKICVDRCGDGECQEIVCLGQGCPCPETPESCPEDCG